MPICKCWCAASRPDRLGVDLAKCREEAHISLRVTTPRPEGQGFLLLRLQREIFPSYASFHKQRRIDLPPLESGYNTALKTSAQPQNRVSAAAPYIPALKDGVLRRVGQ